MLEIPRTALIAIMTAFPQVAAAQAPAEPPPKNVPEAGQPRAQEVLPEAPPEKVLKTPPPLEKSERPPSAEPVPAEPAQEPPRQVQPRVPNT